MDKEYNIKKWLNDELTPAEKEQFEQGEDFALYQAIISEAKHFKASNFSNPEDFDVFRQTYDAKHSKAKSISWYRPLLRIAGLLIIAFGIYFTFFTNLMIDVQTVASQKTTIELPDASKVILNAESKISYDKNDWNTNRELHLNGEAYFKVAKGNTFDVITSQGKVTVVGTAFNVKQRNAYFEVQCFEGIVSVASGKHTETLVAGDTFKLLGDVVTQDTTTLLEPDWTNQTSTFKALPYSLVIAEMERQYNIKITLDNVEIDRLFTGSFMHDDIENALLAITQPMNLTYTSNIPNEVIIHGNKK